MSKVKPIHFKDSNARFQLATKGKVYTLRAKKINGIRRVPETKKPLDVHVKSIDSIKVCLRGDIIICVPSNALDKYVKESGFNDVCEWLEALTQFGYKLPEFPETRAFYVHEVTKVNYPH